MSETREVPRDDAARHAESYRLVMAWWQTTPRENDDKIQQLRSWLHAESVRLAGNPAENPEPCPERRKEMYRLMRAWDASSDGADAEEKAEAVVNYGSVPVLTTEDTATLAAVAELLRGRTQLPIPCGDLPYCIKQADVLDQIRTRAVVKEPSDELRTANEKLRSGAAKCRDISRRLREENAKLNAENEKLRAAVQDWKNAAQEARKQRDTKNDELRSELDSSREELANEKRNRPRDWTGSKDYALLQDWFQGHMGLKRVGESYVVAAVRVMEAQNAQPPAENVQADNPADLGRLLDAFAVAHMQANFDNENSGGAEFAASEAKETAAREAIVKAWNARAQEDAVCADYGKLAVYLLDNHADECDEEGNTYASLAIQLIERSANPAFFDLTAYIDRQRKWSTHTFGPGPRLKGILEHIRRELKEIEESPGDVTEWIDVVILALDGAWRAGYDPINIAAAMANKQQKNFARKWPEPTSEDVAVEHIADPADIQDDPANGGTVEKGEWRCIDCKYTVAGDPDGENELCDECSPSKFVRGNWTPRKTNTADTSEPDHQPDDVWCVVNPDKAIRPDDVACDKRRMTRRAGQDPHMRGLPAMVRKHKHCRNYRTEPDPAEDAMREMGFYEAPALSDVPYSSTWELVAAACKCPLDDLGDEHVQRLWTLIRKLESNQRTSAGKQPVCVVGGRTMSPEMTALFGPIEWPGRGHDFMVHCERLAEAIIDLEANQLDRDATCGECKWQPDVHTPYCHRRSEGDVFIVKKKAAACMKIERKPEPEASEPEKVKARCFRGTRLPDAIHCPLWSYDEGGRGLYFSQFVDRIDDADSTLSEMREGAATGRYTELSEACAADELATRPNCLAKLRELIGGSDA